MADLVFTFCRLVSDLKPLIKWAGGKQNLLKFLLPLLPNKWNVWHEPFLGGGGMLLGVCPEKARANDCNEQLVNFHTQVRDHPVELRNKTLELDGWSHCTRELYMQRRNEFNELLKANVLTIESAAYFLWLNKHCFNGLYRVNPRGEYNVSWNKEEYITEERKNNTVAIASEEAFVEVSKVLAGVQLFCGDFRSFLNGVEKGDLVFLDPPYLPDPQGGDFVSYNKDGFSMDDHEAVVAIAKELASRGVYVMATNNDSPLTREMWSGFHFSEYSTRLCIRPGRKRVEVAMTSWEPKVPLDTIDQFC